MTTSKRTKHKSIRRPTDKKARQGKGRKKGASEIKRKTKPPRPTLDLAEPVPATKGPHQSVADEAANPDDNSPAIDDVVHRPVTLRFVVSNPEDPAATKNTRGMGTGDILGPLRRLTPESNFDDVNVAVRDFAKELTGLPPVERVLFRHQAIKILAKTRLAAGARLMDAALEEVKDSAAGEGELVEGEAQSTGAFPDVVPWPEPVNGQDLLTEIESFVRTYVVLADKYAYVPFVIWAVAAHAHDFFRLFPILVLSSPTKRSGKTTGLTVMSVLAPKPMFTSNTTAAALFHAIDAYHPTVLIDEGDTFINSDEALRGLLNSGHTRDLARVMRKSGWYADLPPGYKRLLRICLFGARGGLSVGFAITSSAPAEPRSRARACWARRLALASTWRAARSRG